MKLTNLLDKKTKEGVIHQIENSFFINITQNLPTSYQPKQVKAPNVPNGQKHN
jgi:hypothetical protein